MYVYIYTCINIYIYHILGGFSCSTGWGLIHGQHDLERNPPTSKVSMSATPAQAALRDGWVSYRDSPAPWIMIIPNDYWVVFYPRTHRQQGLVAATSLSSEAATGLALSDPSQRSLLQALPHSLGPLKMGNHQPRSNQEHKNLVGGANPW